MHKMMNNELLATFEETLRSTKNVFKKKLGKQFLEIGDLSSLPLKLDVGNSARLIGLIVGN